MKSISPDLSDSAAKAVEMLWGFFKAERRWPSRKEFLLRAIDEGLPLVSLRRSSELSLRAGSGDEARPTFAALARLPEVQTLLAPLPRALRQAASVFAAEALAVPDNRLPTLHFRDVRKHWGDSSQAKMAFDTLRSTNSGFFVGGGESGTDPEDFYFSLSIDTLRYEKVEDLDEVLRAPRYPGIKDAGRFPSGKHLELLRRIFEVSRSAQRWPKALEFAIEARTVGYVPQLVAELRPRFVRTEFRASQHSSLVLTLDALPWVDSSGDTRELLARAVAAIVDIWRARSGNVDVPLAELAASLGVSTALLGPAVAFLESSKWCHLSHVTDDHRGLVVVPGDPDLVLRNIGVSTFDEFMNVWDAEEADGYSEILPGRLPEPATAADDQEPPAVPSLCVEFIKSDPYRRVFETDIEELGRTLASRAWKASLTLLGGLLEGVLLDVLSRRVDLTESVMGKTMARASLVDLIEAGVTLRLVQPSVVPFAIAAKDYRDLIHPFRSSVSALRPSEKAVRAVLHALGLVVEELDAAARDGRVAQFEAT
jgi:hypothetical protein